MSAVLHPNALKEAMSTAAPFVDNSGKYNVKGLCEALTLTRKDIAQATAKPPQWFQEYWNGTFKRPSDAKVLKTIEQLLWIYVLVSSLCKEEGQSRLWMRLPNPAFENETPASLIVEGNLDRVRDSLINLLNGGIPA